MHIKKYGVELSYDGRIPKLVEEGTYDDIPAKNLTSPEDVFSFAYSTLRLGVKAEEYVYAIYVDTQNRVLGISEISHGTVNATSLSSREVFMRGLLVSATGLVIIHNHPSTHVEPSMADEAVTQRLYEAGQLMAIPLIDSIIIGGEHYYSFRENNRVIIS